MELLDPTLFQFGLTIVYGLTAIQLIIGWFKPLPYGKFYNSSWGPSMSASLAWFILEIPALILTPLIFPYGKHAANPRAWILISPFIIDTAHRSLIYPLHLKSKSIQRFPILLLVLSVSANIIAIYTLYAHISEHMDYDNDSWFWLRVSGGMLLFIWGFRTRTSANMTLSSLKKEHGKYVVPHGGWFELVSCPNYFGDLVEWFAWFVMTGSTVTLVAFIFSSGNLIPRAYNTHKWYLANFKNYPKTRKAIFPFLF